MRTGLFCRRGELALAVGVALSWALGAGVMAAPNEGLDDSLGELPPPPGGGGDPGEDDPVIEPFGTNLTGDLASRLQALAFGIGSFDTATGTVTIQRTTDSWITLDRNTGAFTIYKPDCFDSTGTLTTTWTAEGLDVSMVGQMCGFDGNLYTLDLQLQLVESATPGVVEMRFSGSTEIMGRNLGVILIETDFHGSWVREADTAIHMLGALDDLLGLAAVMEATLTGTEIYHPDYVPPPAGRTTTSSAQDPDCEIPPDPACLADCDSFYEGQVASAEQTLALARENLGIVTTQANQTYKDTVVTERAIRDACVDAAENGCARNSGYTIVGGVSATIVAGVLRNPIGVYGAQAGMYGGLAVILCTTFDLISGCHDNFRLSVKLADQIRDNDIEAARANVDAAEQNLEDQFVFWGECLFDCCPAVPQP